MMYRNKKRKAAIWILKEICNPKKARVTGLSNFNGPGSYEEVNQKYFDRYSLDELILKKKYEKQILLDAVNLLDDNRHITKFGNVKNVYKTEIELSFQGENALRDGFYEEEIREYANNRIYSLTRIWLPILAIIISLISLFISIFYKR